jgi:hypothetical protein
MEQNLPSPQYPRREFIRMLRLLSLPCAMVLLPKTDVADPSSPPLRSPNGLTGTWRYRSFVNEPTHVDDINKILFGEGVFTIQDGVGGFLATADFGDGYTMAFSGVIDYGLDIAFRFQGKGTGTTNLDWLYDYQGALLPSWPNGVGQLPVMAGSVVRSAPHGSPGGKIAPAGMVASFLAVKIS